MSIFDIVGQDIAIERLQRARKALRVPHGYIFAGPEGVGKHLLAREWAKLLLCEKPVSKKTASGEFADSCGQCPECKLLESGGHPDLHLIYKELARYIPELKERKLLDLAKKVIDVFVIDKMEGYPVRGQAKIFLIDGAEDMNRQTQNALLKTLEEPPPSTFIILVTSQPDLLLPTVRSRCQQINFLGLPEDFTRRKLVENGVDQNQAAWWASFTEGKLGYALKFAKLNLYPVKCQMLESLADFTAAQVLETAAWMVEKAKEFGENYLEGRENYSKSDADRQGMGFLLEVQAYAFRQALRSQAGLLGAQVVDQQQVIIKIGARFGLEGSSAAIRSAARAQRNLESNVNPALIFESLLLNYLDYVRAAARAG